jgi:hypothetical protein
MLPFSVVKSVKRYIYKACLSNMVIGDILWVINVTKTLEHASVPPGGMTTAIETNASARQGLREALSAANAGFYCRKEMFRCAG